MPLFFRIAAGYGLVLLVLLGVAALTLVRLHATAAVEDRLSREDTPALQAIDDLRVQIVNEQIAVTRFEGSTDTSPRGNEGLLQPYFRAMTTSSATWRRWRDWKATPAARSRPRR